MKRQGKESKEKSVDVYGTGTENRISDRFDEKRERGTVGVLRGINLLR